MNDEKRLIEVMAELLAEVHEMRTDTKKQLSTLNSEVDNMKKEIMKMNLQLGENTRAIIKLAEKDEVIPNLIERVIKLETIVLKKAS